MKNDFSFFHTPFVRLCGVCWCATMLLWNNRVQGGLTFILHRMGVVLMKFDFKDLMSFGTFLLALLTFIFLNLR